MHAGQVATEAGAQRTASPSCCSRSWPRCSASAPPARAPRTLPPGFTETIVISGLDAPTAVRFAPDGRVFVAEKAGMVKEFDSLSDTTPRTVVDLRTKVMDYVDRGLLGLAIPPGFPASDPSIYVSYSLDAPIGGTPPVYNDNCPNVTTRELPDGRARLAHQRRDGRGDDAGRGLVHAVHRATRSAGSPSAPTARCTSRAARARTTTRPTGARTAKPPNPCGDPPGPAGTALERPASEGGALRSQDVRTTADPTGLDGTIIRINPQTGAGWPGNPFAASANANAKRIIAYGMRNPWRMTTRPGTDELWFSEVGWGTLEEINRLQIPNDAIAENFGWPCFEGTWRQPFYTGLDLCDSLLPEETVVALLRLLPRRPVVPGDEVPERRRLGLRDLVRADRRTSTPPPIRARSSSATTRAAASGSCSAAPRAARCPTRPT